MTLFENIGYEKWSHYIQLKKEIYDQYCPSVSKESLASEDKWLQRYGCRNGGDIGIHVVPGDLCFIDFGQNYFNEMGFRHFGLVVSICVQKALVIPMTSNPETYRRAYDRMDNPQGKRNLYRIGHVEGMDRKSVLFLNDARYINTARVITVMAHMNPEEQMFKDIQNRLKAIMFPVS